MLDNNTFSPQKIINRAKLLKSFLLRDETAGGLPVEVGIEITNCCNLRCIMCPHTEMVKRKIRPVGQMSLALFKKIVNEVASFAELVYLHGLGESFMHPELFEFIKYAKLKNLRVGISTNATLLNKTKAKELLASGLDYLIFALDGATKTTYEKIRRGAKLSRVEDNIKYFLKLKNKHKSKPFLVMQFICMKENEKEAGIFFQKWQKEGVDVVRIKPKINLKQRDKIAEPVIKPYCFHIFRALNIFYDGTIVPCCEDVHGRYPLGNVKFNSLQEIWNNQKMQTLRRINFQKQPEQVDLCKHCHYPQPSRLQAIGTLALDHLTVKKILPRLEKWLKLNSK